MKVPPSIIVVGILAVLFAIVVPIIASHDRLGGFEADPPITTQERERMDSLLLAFKELKGGELLKMQDGRIWAVINAKNEMISIQTKPNTGAVWASNTDENILLHTLNVGTPGTIEHSNFAAKFLTQGNEPRKE